MNACRSRRYTSADSGVMPWMRVVSRPWSKRNKSPCKRIGTKVGARAKGQEQGEWPYSKRPLMQKAEAKETGSCHDRIFGCGHSEPAPKLRTCVRRPCPNWRQPLWHRRPRTRALPKKTSASISRTSTTRISPRIRRSSCCKPFGRSCRPASIWRLVRTPCSKPYLCQRPARTRPTPSPPRPSRQDESSCTPAQDYVKNGTR